MTRFWRIYKRLELELKFQSLTIEEKELIAAAKLMIRLIKTLYVNYMLIRINN